jgi:hypothetical protein
MKAWARGRFNVHRIHLSAHRAGLDHLTLSRVQQVAGITRALIGNLVAGSHMRSAAVADRQPRRSPARWSPAGDAGTQQHLFPAIVDEAQNASSGRVHHVRQPPNLVAPVLKSPSQNLPSPNSHVRTMRSGHMPGAVPVPVAFTLHTRHGALDSTSFVLGPLHDTR